MIKYYQINAIRKDCTPGKHAGWTNFSINPVSNALGYLVEVGSKYREDQPKKWYIKPLEVNVSGVLDEECAFVSIKGRKKDVESFIQKAVMTKGFNDNWSWGEIEKWRMELRLNCRR